MTWPKLTQQKRKAKKKQKKNRNSRRQPFPANGHHDHAKQSDYKVEEKPEEQASKDKDNKPQP